MDFKEEIKIYTKGNEVLGFVECKDGRYGNFTEKKYKTINNAIRYRGFDKDSCEVYDVSKMASMIKKGNFKAGEISYIMASATTLKERMINVYTPVLLGMIAHDLIDGLENSLKNNGLYKFKAKGYANDISKNIDLWEKEIRFNLRNNKNVIAQLEEQKKYMLSTMNMPIFLLTLAFDGEVMKQAPQISCHKSISDIYTILFLCNYIINFDAMYAELIRKRTGLPYHTRKDLYIDKICSLCERMLCDIIDKNIVIDFNGKQDKLGINNVEIAWKSLDKHIWESDWLSKI